MHNPKVSVILPTIGRDSLYKALESIEIQTYAVFEILVVSKLGIIKDDVQAKLSQKYKNLRFLESTTGKVAENRNLGLSKASGDFIAFLDDDDFWLRNKIQKQIDFMISNEVQICITRAQFAGDTRESVNRPLLKRNENVLKASYGFWWPFKKRPYIGFPTVVIKNESINGVKFDEDLTEREDLWFLHELQNKFANIAQINEVTTVISKSKPFSNRSFSVEQEYDFFRKLEKVDRNLGKKFLINTSLRNAIATGQLNAALELLIKIIKSHSWCI